MRPTSQCHHRPVHVGSKLRRSPALLRRPAAAGALPAAQPARCSRPRSSCRPAHAAPPPGPHAARPRSACRPASLPPPPPPLYPAAATAAAAGAAAIGLAHERSVACLQALPAPLRARYVWPAPRCVPQPAGTPGVTDPHHPPHRNSGHFPRRRHGAGGQGCPRRSQQAVGFCACGITGKQRETKQCGAPLPPPSLLKRGSKLKRYHVSAARAGANSVCYCQKDKQSSQRTTS